MIILVSGILSCTILHILRDGFGDWEWQITEDDLPRMTKSRKVTYLEWPNPGIGQAPEHHLPWSDVTRKSLAKFK